MTKQQDASVRRRDEEDTTSRGDKKTGNLLDSALDKALREGWVGDIAIDGNGLSSCLGDLFSHCLALGFMVGVTKQRIMQGRTDRLG